MSGIVDHIEAPKELAVHVAPGATVRVTVGPEGVSWSEVDDRGQLRRRMVRFVPEPGGDVRTEIKTTEEVS